MAALLLNIPPNVPNIADVVVGHLPQSGTTHHLYLMGLFAQSSAQLGQQLADFQQGYGFFWWQSDVQRLTAEASQDNQCLPARTPAGYWQQLTLPDSLWQRQQHTHHTTLDAMKAKPNELQAMLSDFRSRWDKAQQDHTTTTPKQPGKLWGWRSAGSANRIRQALQQLTLPAHQVHLVCALLSPQPIEEYETLCQAQC